MTKVAVPAILANMESGKYFLGPRGRGILKIVHLVQLSALTGGFVVIGTMQLFKAFPAATDASVFDVASLHLFSSLVNYAAYGVLVTSLCYSFFTQWGFFRYWWIMAKWICLAALYVLALAVTGPCLTAMAAIATGGTSASVTYSGAQASIAGALYAAYAVLALLFFLSVFKPFGRRKAAKERNLLVPGIVVVALALAGIGMGAWMDTVMYGLRSSSVASMTAKGKSDGTYAGKASDGATDYRVEVSVERERITSIKGLELRRAVYVDFAQGVFAKIVAAQRTDVDVVSGATTTSKVLMRAVADALTKR